MNYTLFHALDYLNKNIMGISRATLMRKLSYSICIARENVPAWVTHRHLCYHLSLTSCAHPHAMIPGDLSSLLSRILRWVLKPCWIDNPAMIALGSGKATTA